MADYNKVMHKLDYLDDTKGLIKDAIIEKGQDITDDVTFREYVQKIKEISSGDVKLFNTYEEMYNYEKAKDGDLAIIYNREFEDIYANKSFSAVLIPKVIVIGSTSNNSRIFYVSNLVGCSMNVYIAPFDTEVPENNYISIYLENSKQTITLKYYADETGLVFTFDNGNANIQNQNSQFVFDTDTFIFDFESSLTISNTFDSVFSGMFKIRVIDFQGLYQNTLNAVNENKVYTYKDFMYDTTLNKFVASVDKKLNYKTFHQKITNIEGREFGHYGIFTLNDIENGMPKTAINYGDYYNLLYYNDTYFNMPYLSSFNDRASAESYVVDNKEVITTYNLLDNTFTITQKDFSIIEVEGTEDTKYYVVGSEVDTLKDTTCLGKIVDSGISYINKHNINIYRINTETLSLIASEFNVDYVYEDSWVLAPMQFTAFDNSHLVTNRSAYGSKGIITGDGTYLKHVTTKEYNDYFAPQLPVNAPELYTYILKNGERVPYYSYIKRVGKAFDDLTPIGEDNTLATLMSDIETYNLTNATYTRAYNCQSHKTFYVEKDNRLYYGYFGFNRTNRESPGNPGQYTHETITAIHGVLVDLVSKEVIKEVNYTESWTPFDGWGNDNENPNADISYLNYDVLHNEFIMVVTTGTWAWSNESAPYLAILKINGSTGEATPTRWQIGKNGAPRTYAQVYDVRYDITTKNLIIPIKSFDTGGANSIVDRIVKLDTNGNKTLWVNMNGTQLDGLNRMGDEESFYTKAPIYYYFYTDGSGVKHHILKNISSDVSVEIPTPYSFYSDKRLIYNGYLYYISTNRSGDGYAVIKVNINTMTYDEYGTFKSTNGIFILLDRVPYIYFAYYLYSLNDLDEPAYLYYADYTMYNDLRTDGVTIGDGCIEGMYLRAKANSTGINLTRKNQLMYEYSLVDTFPVDGDLMIAWPPIDNAHTMGTLYMYQSLWLSTKNYDGTISPFDYQRALRTARQIEGRVY